MKLKPNEIRVLPSENECAWSLEARARRAREDGIELIAVLQSDGTYRLVGDIELARTAPGTPMNILPRKE